MVGFDLGNSTAYDFVTFLDSLISIIAVGGGGLFVIINRKKISSFFKLLQYHALTDTIVELTAKLEQLNGRSANDKNTTIKTEIVCLMSEIVGQIEGNKFLHDQCDKQLLKKFLHYASNPDELDEPLKRGLVAQMRENLKTIKLAFSQDLAGSVKK